MKPATNYTQRKLVEIRKYLQLYISIIILIKIPNAMKLSLFMVFILFSTFIYTQEFSNSKVLKDVKVEFNTLAQSYICEDVLSVDSVNQNVLYDYASIWLTNMDFKTCRNKDITLEKEKNRIVGYQYFNLKSYSYRLHCKLILYFKDGRFKFSYGSFDFGSTSYTFSEIVTQKKYSDIIPEVEKVICDLMNSLHAHLIQAKLKEKW